MFTRMNKLRTLRALALRKKPSPLGALGRGLIAGAVGAGMQSLFFMASKKLQPKPTKVPRRDSKPEPQAIGESSLETVARRTIDGMMQRHEIGVDTGRLVNSFASKAGADTILEVGRLSVTVGTRIQYAGYFDRLRPIWGPDFVDAGRQAELEAIVRKWLDRK